MVVRANLEPIYELLDYCILGAFSGNLVSD